MVAVAPLTFCAMLGVCLVAGQGIQSEPCTGAVCGASTEPGASALLQNKHSVEKKTILASEAKAKKQLILNRQEPDLSASGAAATLDEAGYQSVASMCCPSEAFTYGRRVVHQLGFDVCNTGDLSGVMHHFYCSTQNRTYDQLVTDILESFQGTWYGVECAWVAWPGQCKEKAAHCPVHLPDPNDPNAPIIGTRGTCCYPMAATAFAFDNAQVITNNLAGKGPNFGDPQELRYAGAGSYKGRPMHLVVTASASYNPHTNANQNGLNGKFGTVNLWAGSSAEFTFEIQDAQTRAPIVLDEFYFSFLDLDEEDTRIREKVYATDFVDRVLEPVSDIIETELPDGSTSYESTKTAGAWNNPTDPMVLGVVTDPNWVQGSTRDQFSNQRKEALMFIYRKISSWKLTLEVTHTEGAPHGRNFLFGGTSALIDICPRKQDPVPSAPVPQ